MDVSLRITEDGSHTLYSPDIGDQYHSKFGAVMESQHVFIDAGLKHVLEFSKTLRILEIGFGTGLNLLLTLRSLNNIDHELWYHGVDKYPLPNTLIKQLNYPENEEKALFQRIHSTPWDLPSKLESNITLLKENADFSDFKAAFHPYNLVYFDAFSPDLQPQLWSTELFQKIADSCVSGAILTTYSSKGMVKRNLKSAGFHVTKLPGPPGKREIVRAIKD